ncbi:DUF6900 domain-containing protein [Streptococcus hyointestinalis]|uniref:DUF6900 domain-containing protein n=1 Tax=Streptococcus hyointestinalis TaxID=1337 RepID=UPI003CFF8763
MKTFKNNHEACGFETQVPSRSNLEEQIREIFNSEDENPETDEILTQIAQQVGRIPTLDPQHLDSQDFHDVSVWRLRELLRVSYELGRSHAQNKAVTPTFEKAQEAYRQTYLELEISDAVEFGRFSNFDLDYENIFEEENFKVRHKLNGEQTLEYTCQFKDFETAQNLYHLLDEADDFNFRILLNHLNEQEVIIVDRAVN